MYIIGHVITNFSIGHHPFNDDIVATHLKRGYDWFASSPSWGTFFPFYATLLLSVAVVPDFRVCAAVFLRVRTWLSSSGGCGGHIKASTVRFTISGSIFSFRGGFFSFLKRHLLV